MEGSTQTSDRVTDGSFITAEHSVLGLNLENLRGVAGHYPNCARLVSSYVGNIKDANARVRRKVVNLSGHCLGYGPINSLTDAATPAAGPESRL